MSKTSGANKQRPVRVGLISLGCAKNLVDAEIMLGSLIKSGLEITNDAASADAVIVNKPTAQAGLGIVGARVSAADTLAITFSNNTGSGITPTASEVYKVIAFRS